MKLFKYLAILLVFLVAAFIAIGILNPQLDYRTEVDIAKSPAAAFKLMASLSSTRAI